MRLVAHFQTDVKGFVPLGLCMLHAVALQQEGHVFDGQGLFCVELTCSPCACVDFLWVLQLHPTVRKHAFVARIVLITPQTH